jgi:hypothetical protein
MATINIANLSFTHRGDYDGSTAYVKNDVVYYSTNGNAYIAKQNTTGNAPTNGTYWSQFAAGSGGIWNAGLSLGSAEQIVQVNSAGNALEFVAKPVGIGGADMFRMIGNSTSAQDPITNLERVDDATFAKIGTGMSESSGIFTFPETGLWFVRFNWDGDSSNTGGNMRIHASSDSGSNYDRLTDPHVGDGQGWYIGASTEAMINVTNASTFRVKFEKTGTWNMYGNTAHNRTYFTFIRLGDSQ